jgi:hypothetical protein
MSKNSQTLTKFQFEVNALLNQFSEANNQFFNYEVGHSNEVDDKWFDGDALEALSNLRTNGLNWSKVKSHGGGEGDGEECWTVYKFYQSYSGSGYHDFFVVEPVQRMVTFYEAV